MKPNNFFSNFQSFLKESQGETIPNEIIKVLVDNGFDNILAMTEINQDDIPDIEKCADTVLLPGNKKYIIALGKKAKQYESYLAEKQKSELDLSAATLIMKELLKTATQNANVPPTRHRYSEIIQWFSTYIYLLSGRAAYEFLSCNLPLPSVPTICE